MAALTLPLTVAAIATGQVGDASGLSTVGGGLPSLAAARMAPVAGAVAPGLQLPGGALTLAPSVAVPPGPHRRGRPQTVPSRALPVPSLGSPPKAHRGGAGHSARRQLPPGREEELGRSFLGMFLVTCYDLTGPTASGAMAGPESVAVDPSVVPLGTHIYIDGVGPRTADDTGGAIVGQRLDIWEPSYSACTDWGAQERAVYRLMPPT